MSDRTWAFILVVLACLFVLMQQTPPADRAALLPHLPSFFMLAAIYLVLVAIHDELRKDK